METAKLRGPIDSSYPGNSQITMSSRSQATTVWIGTAVQAETSFGGGWGPSPPNEKEEKKKRKKKRKKRKKREKKRKKKERNYE